MRCRWDEKKSKKLKKTRGLGFDELLIIFNQTYHLSQKRDDPEQWRAIGWVHEKLVSLIYEEREDEEGNYLWLITYWTATQGERKLFSEEP